MGNWRLSKNAKYYVKINSVFLAITFSLVLINTPHVTYDGWQYISSGKSLFDGTFFENYFFVRKPLYPLFLGLCLNFFGSLWAILLIQTYLCVATIGLLIEAVVNHTKQDKTQRILHKVLLGLVCWLILGSLPSFILQQNAILILFAVIARMIWKGEYSAEDHDKKTKYVWSRWALLASISFLISLEIFFMVLLLVIVLTIRKRLSLKNLLLVALVSSLVAIGVTFGFNQLHRNAQQANGYNTSNLSDPFLKEDLSKNLKDQLINPNPPYTQKVVRGFLANLDLSPTVGWDGVYTEIYEEPGHPMRAFGLNHIMQQMPLCNSFPEQGVIAVREEYVKQYEGCINPMIQIPNRLKPILYGLYLVYWPLIVLIAIFGRYKQFLWLPGIVLVVYALLGAGISRYGMVVYPSVIMVAYANLALQLKERNVSGPERK